MENQVVTELVISESMMTEINAKTITPHFILAKRNDKNFIGNCEHYDKRIIKTHYSKPLTIIPNIERNLKRKSRYGNGVYVYHRFSDEKEKEFLK